jgi:hypothetical protein
MNTTRSILMLLIGAALSTGCEKNAVQVIAEPSMGTARIKFFNFGVGAPGVNFYANDTKITAVSTTACAILTDANRDLCTTTGNESTTGVNYGGVGSGGYYAAIVPGQYALAGKIAAATDKGLAISNLSATLEDGKLYSFYQSGFYDTGAKAVDAFVVEDPLPTEFDYSVAYVRFVHAISNANAMTLYATTPPRRKSCRWVGPCPTRGGGLHGLAPGTYDLGARYAGSATNAISRTAVAFTAGRVYTIGARGDITITSTTATNRPFLDNTANR